MDSDKVFIKKQQIAKQLRISSKISGRVDHYFVKESNELIMALDGFVFDFRIFSTFLVWHRASRTIHKTTDFEDEVIIAFKQNIIDELGNTDLVDDKLQEYRDRWSILVTITGLFSKSIKQLEQDFGSIEAWLETLEQDQENQMA